MVHESVIGWTECGIACIDSIAAAVDQRLWMLNAKANGKTLGFDIHAALVDHLKRIPGAVSDGQHKMIGSNLFTAGKHHAPHCTVNDFKIVHTALKTDLSTE